MPIQIRYLRNEGEFYFKYAEKPLHSGLYGENNFLTKLVVLEIDRLVITTTVLRQSRLVQLRFP